jgi:integrase
MPKSKSRKKKSPKRVLALPDPEQAKTAVLNSLTSASGQHTYEHAIREFVAWYCSEPRLAFNRTVVLRYRIHLEQCHYAPATINLRLIDQIRFLLGHVSIQTTERYLGCKQRLRCAVNDRLGIEPDAA